MAKSTGRIEISIDHDETVAESFPISKNQGVHQGIAFFAKIIIPQFPSGATASLDIIDADDDVIYTVPGLAHNITHIVYDFQLPLVEKEKFRLTLSEAPGGAGSYSIFAALYYSSDF